MFRKILVPVDLTPKNARALETARDLAANARAEVIVLHVIETIDAPFEELEDFYRRLEDNARERMHALAEPLREADIPFHQQICFGKRAPEIVSFAQDHDCDLIVVNSHRLDPDHPTKSWMTISHQVALLAPTPVLLLK